MFATLLLAACQKDDTPQWIEVTAEGYDGQKVAIDGHNATWSDGDELRINGTTASVSRHDGHAYIDASDGNETGTNRALYPASLSASALTADAVTVSLPAVYRYRTDGAGRQLLELPMAARADAGKPLHFRHLTGALSITVSNNLGQPIDLDRLSVASDSYRLSGSRDIDFADLASQTPVGGVSEAERTVAIEFDGVSLADGQSLSVLIPVAPVGSGNHFTVSVASHRQGTRYTYSRTQGDGGTLARNQLGQAGVDIRVGEYVGSGDLFAVSGSHNNHRQYLISTPKDFVLMAEAVSSDWTGSDHYKECSYLIGNDLDMTGYTISPIVGYNGYGIEGGGHTVSNLGISTTDGACALFGRLKDANVTDLNLTNLTLASSHSGSILLGAIADTLMSSTVQGCTVNGVTTTLSGTPTDIYYGGIAATSSGDCTIESCSITHQAALETTGGRIYYGGVVAYSNGTNNNKVNVNRCDISSFGSTFKAASNVLYGGIIGYSLINSTIGNCEWYGYTSSIAFDGTAYIGGLVGRIGSDRGITISSSCSGGGGFETDNSSDHIGKYCGKAPVGVSSDIFNSCDITLTVNGSIISQSIGL